MGFVCGGSNSCSERHKSVTYLRSIYHLFHSASIMGPQLYAPLLDTRAYTADQSHLMKTNVLACRRK